VSDTGIFADQLFPGLGAILTTLGFARKTAVEALEALEFGA
jgi:hypothetical protein